MLNSVCLYRMAYFLHCRHVPIFPRILDYLIRILFVCWLPHNATIGRRVVLGYGGLGIVIHGEAHVGDDVHIDQDVTIGGNATKLGMPTIGKGVYVGAGAKIQGPFVISNYTIVTNAVVVTDIPSNCLAVEVPTRVIRKDIDPASFLYHLSPAGKIPA